jgi:hypothetical protein
MCTLSRIISPFKEIGTAALKTVQFLLQVKLMDYLILRRIVQCKMTELGHSVHVCTLTHS